MEKNLRDAKAQDREGCSIMEMAMTDRQEGIWPIRNSHCRCEWTRLLGKASWCLEVEMSLLQPRVSYMHACE